MIKVNHKINKSFNKEDIQITHLDEQKLRRRKQMMIRRWWLLIVAWTFLVIFFSPPVNHAYVPFYRHNSNCHDISQKISSYPFNSHPHGRHICPRAKEARWSVSSSLLRSQKMTKKDNEINPDIKNSFNKNYLYRQNNIWTKSLTTITGQWRVMYLQLQKHYQREGHLNKIKDAKLRSWLIYQRTLYHKNKLHIDRQQALEHLGEKWKMTDRRKKDDQRKKIKKFLQDKDDYDPNNLSWEYYCQLLMDFYVRNGHTQVPFSSKQQQINHDDDASDTNMDLAIWINSQKLSFQKGTLSQDKYEALSSMGVLFTQSRKEFAWISHYRALYYFVEAYGHSRVPERYAHHPSLGQWVSQLRHNQGKHLNSEQRQALDALDFQWESVPQQNWLQTYEQLKQYLLENYNLVPILNTNSNALPANTTAMMESKSTSNSATIKDIQEITDFSDEFRPWLRHQLRQYPKWESILDTENTMTKTADTEAKDDEMDKVSSNRNITKKMKSIAAKRKRLLDEIGFESWGQNLIQNSKTNRGTKNKKAIGQNDWNALFDQMRQRGINANAPLTVLPNPKTKQQEAKFEHLSEQDLIDLWNEEDDEDDDDFF